MDACHARPCHAQSKKVIGVIDTLIHSTRAQTERQGAAKVEKE